MGLIESKSRRADRPKDPLLGRFREKAQQAIGEKQRGMDNSNSDRVEK